MKSTIKYTNSPPKNKVPRKPLKNANTSNVPKAI